jgi:hypothetical protein
MTTYQMLWDCKYCGTQKLLGVTHRHCPTCGAPQDASARYFPSEADKVTALDHPFVGADVVCPACQEANSKRNQHCFNCGSPLTEAAPVHARSERVIDAGATAPIDSKAAAILEATGREPEGALLASQDKPEKTARRGVTRTLAYVLVPLVALPLGFVMVNMLWTQKVVVQAVRHHWVRDIAVEQYSDVRGGAWCDELPMSARVIDRRMATRGTRSVPDGQSCSTHQVDNGDGTFREREECQTKYRSEPVLAPYCTYLVTKWHVDRTAEAEGDTLDPAWPSTHLIRTGDCVGCEREGQRQERYEVYLRDSTSSKEDSCEFPEAKWRSIADGTELEAKRRLVGGLVCDALVQQ